MRQLRQDVQYAVRGLLGARAFAAIAILTLALGIGANTAIFSLLDEALLQRLPVPHPEQLRTVIVVTQTGWQSNVPAEFFDQVRQPPPSFSDICASYRMEMNLDAGGDIDRVLVQTVSGRYYSTLGVSMLLGRGVNENDEKEHAHVAVLSHRFWMRRFGGSPQVLGSTVRVNGVPTTIVGVEPSGFFGIDRGVSPEVSMPLNPSSLANLWVTGRLRPGATDRQAQAELDVALRRAIELMKPRLGRYRDSERNWYLTLRAGLQPADSGIQVAMRNYIEPLRVLIVLSTVVLLIACLNLANLLLARALARSHEFGVRLALGAGRGRLIRQVLTESALLAALGTLVGIAVAVLIHRVLLNLVLETLRHQSVEFSLNAHVLGFTIGTAAATTLLFGLVPALRATRVDVTSALKATATTVRGGRQGLAKGLVAVQVAAALVLLLGAGLALRSFRNISTLDTGVSLDRMLTMRVGLGPRETQRRQSSEIYTTLVRRVERIPGVDSVALGWDFAFGSGSSGKSIWVEGQPPESTQGAAFNVVGPGFFKTAGISLIAGREFTESDNESSRKVVIVNEALVRKYFGDRYAIGSHVGDQGAASIKKYEIVGVVKDSRTMFLRQNPYPTLYQPLLQDDWASNVVLHVRTHESPALLQERVRAEIRALDPALPVYDITTLSERRSLALQQDRMMAVLSACFGVVALLLTAIGVFGVIAYSTNRRRAEIGIRVALGATAADVRRLIVRETAILVGVGATIGVPLSLSAARAIQSMLFGVPAQDPVTLIASVVLLLGVGCAAGYLPAVRAARVDPISALRAE
jgi:predicted permease